jgi:bacteriocin-like protein
MQFEVLSEAELAAVVGGVDLSANAAFNPRHAVYKLAGLGGCGCGNAHG